MIDEPNVVLPLASSYNERGVAGYTHVITNGEDQRKVNCFYELSKNPMTGKGTLTLSKRPGVSDSSGGAGWGTSSQDIYLIIGEPNNTVLGKEQGSVPPWVINISGGQIRASSATVDTNIVSSISVTPYYIDKTFAASVETVVLQVRAITAPISTSQKVYFSSAIASWTEISDGDFTPLIHRGKMEHMDGFAFILTDTNRIFNSDTNSLANWTATNFISKQMVQDNAVGLAKLGNQIVGFGDDTAEIFFNAGNTVGSPLGRVTQLHQRVGLIAPNVSGNTTANGHYYCTIGKRIFFVGRASGGIKSAGAFAYDGQSFDKISSPYIDKVLSEIVNSSFYSVNAVGFQGQQAMSILLTNPNAISQRSLIFFPEWKEWFEWTSSVFSPINSGEHFLSCGTNLKDKIYNFTASDNWADDGTNYQWLTQFRVPSNGSNLHRMGMYGVDADTDTSANTISVEASDNDCQSFYSLPSLDLTQDRKMNFRGGSYRKRHMRLTATDSRPKRIHSFLARVD